MTITITKNHVIGVALTIVIIIGCIILYLVAIRPPTAGVGNDSETVLLEDRIKRLEKRVESDEGQIVKNINSIQRIVDFINQATQPPPEPVE